MTSAPRVRAATDLPQPPPAPVSFEDFLAWATKEDVRAEWVDGEIIVMSPVSPEHQTLLDFINDLVKTYVRLHSLGEVLFAPILMRLTARPRGREPDLLFVAAEHADRIGPTYVTGPADLVVEIVSPDSVNRDRGDKFTEYEEAGIREYWLIDPLRQEASFYHLDQAGHYRRSEVASDGIYRSAVLTGFWLRVSWLWQRPLPSAFEAIAHVTGRDGARAMLAALREALGDDEFRALLAEQAPKGQP